MGDGDRRLFCRPDLSHHDAHPRWLLRLCEPHEQCQLVHPRVPTVLGVRHHHERDHRQLHLHRGRDQLLQGRLTHHHLPPLRCCLLLLPACDCVISFLCPLHSFFSLSQLQST